eukprot:1158019-Pelagomonas_calceolata.AAC.7
MESGDRCQPCCLRHPALHLGGCCGGAPHPGRYCAWAHWGGTLHHAPDGDGHWGRCGRLEPPETAQPFGGRSPRTEASWPGFHMMPVCGGE